MNSMTAFGSGEASSQDLAVVVELRSVNHRFRDINVRVPREYTPLEPRIVTVIRDSITRGRIDCTVRRVASKGSFEVRPNLALAESYLKSMELIARHLQREPSQVDLGVIFAQPGVLELAELQTDITHEWDVLEPALMGAIAHMKDMRGTEGRALLADIKEHSKHLGTVFAELQLLSQGVVQKLHARLKARLVVLLREIDDPSRLAQEAAYLADKADVSEEMKRLQSHLDQFAELLESNAAVGRKMEFLLQEMGREINTLGSKSHSGRQGRLVVEFKSVLERLREQAANVE